MFRMKLTHLHHMQLAAFVPTEYLAHLQIHLNLISTQTASAPNSTALCGSFIYAVTSGELLKHRVFCEESGDR